GEVVRDVAEDGDLEPVVGELLDDLAGDAGAEAPEVVVESLGGDGDELGAVVPGVADQVEGVAFGPHRGSVGVAEQDAGQRHGGGGGVGHGKPPKGGKLDMRLLLDQGVDEPEHLGSGFQPAQHDDFQPALFLVVGELGADAAGLAAEPGQDQGADPVEQGPVDALDVDDDRRLGPAGRPGRRERQAGERFQVLAGDPVPLADLDGLQPAVADVAADGFDVQP